MKFTYLALRIIGKTLSTQKHVVNNLLGASSLLRNLAPSKILFYRDPIFFLFSPSIYRIIAILAFNTQTKMAPPRYSLSLSRIVSRLLDNPRDLSWLMPG